MVSELKSHVFKGGIVGGKFDTDFQHVLTEQRDPRSAIRLFQMATGGQCCAAIEHTDVVQPKETTLEQVLAVAVFTVYPPTEVQHQLGKRPRKKVKITLPFQRLLGPVQEDRAKCVNGWIHIAEVPLIRRDLPRRV